MMIIMNMVKVLFTTFLIVGLLFSSGVFSVLLYAKMTGKDFFTEAQPIAAVLAEGAAPAPPVSEAKPEPVKPKPASAMLDAPLVRQLPELPAGCEIVSLTMLLNYYGVDKDKMELYREMIKDPTPIRWEKGAIAYWGNPNTGYVGDATGKSRGFGIYHGALLPTLKEYVPTAIDMTGMEFDAIERQIAEGLPVVIWTTINFQETQKWVEWDTPIGPIKTTFMEHAVLLVGYDEENVYVNDPYSGKKSLKLNKEQFLGTWNALGKQALSYTND
ncbi:C39 family peptidase [Paenibacillus sp. GYB004]|uniref:C39 family peptidase n=1 Tax=Paenibacillus sp. GYB004 TaxID=2994393 RepID=UPI002F966A0B